MLLAFRAGHGGHRDTCLAGLDPVPLFSGRSQGLTAATSCGRTPYLHEPLARSCHPRRWFMQGGGSALSETHAFPPVTSAAAIRGRCACGPSPLADLEDRSDST